MAFLSKIHAHKVLANTKTAAMLVFEDDSFELTYVIIYGKSVTGSRS